tara:strand:+ start:568 stop:753 length:186 start_codon:yes stop_codon:yes gene_type:complete
MSKTSIKNKNNLLDSIVEKFKSIFASVIIFSLKFGREAKTLPSSFDLTREKFVTAFLVKQL